MEFNEVMMAIVSRSDAFRLFWRRVSTSRRLHFHRLGITLRSKSGLRYQSIHTLVIQSILLCFP